MNCKQGDLAVITRDARGSPTAGKFCTVLYAAPIRVFNLPDGHAAQPGKYGDWVIELQTVIDAQVLCGEKIITRKTRYAVLNDKYLRPIRDNPGADETLTWQPVPEKETA